MNTENARKYGVFFVRLVSWCIGICGILLGVLCFTLIFILPKWETDHKLLFSFTLFAATISIALIGIAAIRFAPAMFLKNFSKMEELSANIFKK